MKIALLLVSFVVGFSGLDYAYQFAKSNDAATGYFLAAVALLICSLAIARAA